MKITIDNRDLDYTVDMYQTYPIDLYEDSEIDYILSSDFNDYDTTYKDAGVTAENFSEKVEGVYDNAGYLKHLAENSIRIIEGEYKDAFDYSEPREDGTREKIPHGIIKSITLKDTGSPQFYNYTTDHYTAVYEFNSIKLVGWIKKNKAAYDAWLNDNYDAYEREKLSDVASDVFDKEYMYISMLRYYMLSELSEESYSDAMYETMQPNEYITFKLIEEEKQNA